MAPDDFPYSRNHGPEYRSAGALSREEFRHRRVVPGENWGKFLASILKQMSGLENLTCNFFQYMWKGLETYDAIPGLQNLYALNLHGVGSFDLRLTALPRLRKLRLDGIYLNRSDDECGVTDLELIEDRSPYDHRHGTPPVENCLQDRSYFPTFELSGFTSLARLSVTCSRSNVYANQTLRTSSLFKNIQACAATLRKLELHILDK